MRCGAVAGPLALEAVAFHNSGEALALAGARDVDGLTGGEQLGGDLLTGRIAGGIGSANLNQVPSRGDPRLLEVPGHRLGDLAAVDLAEPDLHSGVAIGLGLAYLGHDVRWLRR
jgi:hypothetical protein